MLRKRGQGLSLNVIILAALGLIILVVLVMIVTGRLHIFGEKVDIVTEQKCTDKAGVVYDSRDECINAGGSISYGVYSDVKTEQDQVCCVFE